MARKNKTFEKAINELLSDYETALTKAMQDASDKALQDIWGYSFSCLEDYYDSYEPNSYWRTYSLEQAFVPYLNIEHDNDSITSTVGITYDSSRLDGLYHGSKKYQNTDGAWILDNYLRGVHPATDGSPIPGGAFYYEIVDPVSPSEKMETYLNKYYSTFQNSVLTSFVKQAKARMK